MPKNKKTKTQTLVCIDCHKKLQNVRTGRALRNYQIETFHFTRDETEVQVR